MLFNKNGNGTQEISSIATWTTDHDYEHIYRALLLAKRKVLKIIDKATYQLALDHYNSDDYQVESPTARQSLLDSLVLSFQTVFVNFAYQKNMQKDQVLWGNSGINIAWTEEHRPAQKETLDELSKSLEQDAYEFLDLLIELLNDNPKTFTDFHKSVENLDLKKLFINDAEEFNYYFDIRNSVAYFFEIADTINRVQRTHIYSALSREYYNKVTDYQVKRLELEQITNSVDIIDNLPPTVSEKTIYLVEDIQEFYKYDGKQWKYYAYNAVELLKLVKPATVDYTMFTKFVADISNLHQTDKKQIETIRANRDFLLQKAEVSSSHIVQFIADLQPETEITDDTIEQTLGYRKTYNSFMI